MPTQVATLSRQPYTAATDRETGTRLKLNGSKQPD